MKETERKRVRELFERETGCNWTYGEIRRAVLTGYTELYLRRNFEIEILETTAEMEKVLEFVKLDLAEGTKPKEVVFGCCDFCPQLLNRLGQRLKTFSIMKIQTGTTV